VMSRSVNRESDKAGAQQDKAGNGYSEEAVGSEFVTHGSPPVVCPCPNNTTVPMHSQRNSARMAISIPTDDFKQHSFESA
jgi:hypothetical protein